MCGSFTRSHLLLFGWPLQAGHTPLLLAAFYGRTAVVALLLATPGVDPLAKAEARGAERLVGVAVRAPCPCPPYSPLQEWDETALDAVHRGGHKDSIALFEADPRVVATIAL